MIGCVIPTRGDRPQFLNQCLLMLARQTLKPDVVEVVSDESGLRTDLTWRYRIGYERLSEQGCTKIFCIEDDDYYQPGYIEQASKLIGNYDMIGFSFTTYYHLRERKYCHLKEHLTHSSMFQTVLKGGLDMDWPHDSTVFLDMELWRDSKKRLNKKLLRTQTGCLGIKHGIGKFGGKGHLPGFFNNQKSIADHDLSYLRSVTGKSFNFYKQVSEGLQAGTQIMNSVVW